MATLNEMILRHYKLSLQLNDGNDKAYENIVVYLRSSNLSEREAEELIDDVLEMLLAAQHRGESATDIFGDDLQKFCDEMIAANGKSNIKRRIHEHLSIVIKVFLIIFGLDYLFNQLPAIFMSKQDWLTAHIYLDTLVLTFLFVLIGLIVVKYIGQTAFKGNYAHKFIAVLVISFIGAICKTIIATKEVILFSLPLYIGLPIILLLGFLSIKLYK
ncbi:MAG: DUF1129 family protein [Bacillaceae bacterium]